MDEAEEVTPIVGDTQAEMKQLLGMFDAPAFVRRGHDLEYALNRLDQRLRRERDGLLDMVRVRLRQWAGCACGPDDYRDAFTAPVADLWPLAGAEPPAWAVEPAPPRRRRTVARDLVASVTRFNHRWSQYLARLPLDRVNGQIDHYNRYYVLEKECVLGSARLAAKNFVPKPRLNAETLLVEHPPLPVPGLVA